MSRSRGSAVDDYRDSYVGPIEKLLCFRRLHIDTPVTHRVSEVAVPISAVDAVTAAFGDTAAVKIHHIGHIGQVVIRTKCFAPSRHFGCAKRRPDIEGTIWCPAP